MRKIIFICFVALAVILNPRVSSSQAFENGTNILGAGVGFGSALGPATFGIPTPSISVQYEHGTWDVGGPGVISLGGYLAYSSFADNNAYYGNGYYYNTSWNYTIIGFRGAYHYNGLRGDAWKAWDFYGGIMLSLDIESHSSNNPNYDLYYNYPSQLYFTPYVGARYFVTPKLCFYGELGYGISYLTVGIAFKL